MSVRASAYWSIVRFADMSIQLGAHIGMQNASMEELRALWRYLDASGLDWLSVWDHLYEVPPAGGTQPHFESLTTLGALCADTSNVRVGVLVFYVGYRNPAYLAKAATTLDHISGGRFELGLGGGWAKAEAEAYGYGFPSLGTRMDMVEDALPLVRSMLSQERTSYQGSFFATEDAANIPQPLRPVPIWVGGTGEKRTPRIAAEYADGWNVPYVSPRQYRFLNERVDAACEAAERDPATLERSVNLGFYLATDQDQLVRTETQLREATKDMPVDFLEGVLLATPDQAVERLMEYVQAGAQGINVALRPPVDTEALAAYLEVVVPAVRKEAA